MGSKMARITAHGTPMRSNRDILGYPLSPLKRHTRALSLANDSLILLEQFAISWVKGRGIHVVRVFKGRRRANLTNGRDNISVRVVEVALETPLVLVCFGHVDSLDGDKGHRRVSRRHLTKNKLPP